MIEDIELKCSVGALLYTPALNDKVSAAVISERFGRQYSIAFCLEDTISDDMVETAEKQVIKTLAEIHESNKKFYLPKMFIRVRNPEQIRRIYNNLGNSSDILCGFIFPKYSVNNAEAYNSAVCEINRNTDKKVYMMPILESPDIADYSTRSDTLLRIKKHIDSVKSYVMNVRVGGNDFSNEFSVRRHCNETIYDIRPVARILEEILTIFSREYIVSGPVWEFFSGINNDWKNGMERELRLDKLNGFIGKTVIHPNQIDIVNQGLKVPQKDYDDAREILGWKDNSLQVGKSTSGERMNEVKTHMNWAFKTLVLAKVYGVI